MHNLSRREVLLASVVACSTVSWLPAGMGALAHDSVWIPAGPFIEGTSRERAGELALQHGYDPSWLQGELPQRLTTLPAYRIDRYPVTNLRYAEFCRSTGHPLPPHWTGSLPHGQLDHPVVLVDRQDALDFAAWDGGRLPTVAEWEKAAGGLDGRTFPWGEAFDPGACNFDPGGVAPPAGLTPVDAHPLGASPYGVEDMVGNAAEWCADGPGVDERLHQGRELAECFHLEPALRSARPERRQEQPPPLSGIPLREGGLTWRSSD